MPWQEDQSASVETVLAWAAGLFEGEGWFTVQRDKNGRADPVACISMTDRDVVERFRDAVGWGSIWSVDKGPGNKRQWRCATAGTANVTRFGQLVGPWLGDRRRSQLERVLSAPAPRRIHPSERQLRLIEETA